MTKSEENKNAEFKVNDRRRFDAEGNPREPAQIKENTENSKISPEENKNEAQPLSREEEITANFPSLVFSLAASAQAGLGLSAQPLTGKPEKNLAQAKYSIDLLGVLEEKTRGNLNSEEKKLLEVLLYDLRMRFLEEKAK